MSQSLMRWLERLFAPVADVMGVEAIHHADFLEHADYGETAPQRTLSRRYVELRITVRVADMRKLEELIAEMDALPAMKGRARPRRETRELALPGNQQEEVAAAKAALTMRYDDAGDDHGKT